MTAALLPQATVAVNGIELAYFEWGVRGAARTVLLVHATGFHARCWDGVARALLGDDLHMLAVDLRGHGRSSKQGPYDWHQFGDDMTAFVETLDLDAVVGVGHSMGGHAVTNAAAQQPGRFAALLLVDPVILEPAAYAQQRAPFATAEEHPVARRRNHWQSAEQMFRHFEHRSPFSLWRPDVLMDYCRFGLLPHGAPEEALTLACPPLVEASIYMGSAGGDILDIVAGVRQPAVVLRAQRKAARSGAMDFSQSPTWEGLAAAFPQGRDVYLPHLTHFIPMQRPDLVAEHIRTLAEVASGSFLK